MANELTLLDKFHAFRARYFPERQLFLRSEGRVRFLTIGSYTQMSIASALSISLIWGGVTSYAYLSSDLTLQEKNRTISTMSAQYQALSSDFSALEVEVERRALQLETRQKFLEEMVGTPAEPLPEAATINQETEDASSTEAGPDTSENLNPAAQDSTFIERIFGTGTAQAAVHSNIDRRKNLLYRLQDMEMRQRSLATSMRDNAFKELAAIDSVLAPTKLGSTDLIDKLTTNVDAQGGPFVADVTFEPIFNAEDGNIYAELFTGRQRLEMVTMVLDSFPVGKPAEKYYLSSKFGRRKDPLKKTWANHPGLDLAGWPGTAIYTTARGKVVHAGWYGPYGNMVEVDHGNGFKTRYGHLRKIRVAKGDEVTLGQRLGDMGKTGRVTGTHLHYEVWFDGKVRDPMPYMKAANDVLEIQGRHEKTSQQ